MALLDTFDCVNSGLALNEHLVDSFKALKTMKLSTALLNLGLLVHKSPVAYQYCWRVFDDAKSLMESFGTNFNLPHFLANTGFNTLINFAEIYNQWGKGIDGLHVGNYSTFGQSVGRITSNMLIKTPLSPSWSYNNSDIFTAQLALGVPTSDYMLPQ